MVEGETVNTALSIRICADRRRRRIWFTAVAVSAALVACMVSALAVPALMFLSGIIRTPNPMEILGGQHGVFASVIGGALWGSMSTYLAQKWYFSAVTLISQPALVEAISRRIQPLWMDSTP